LNPIVIPFVIAMMSYSGFTWVFKSSGVQLSVTNLKQILEDKGAKSVGQWEFGIRDYSNHHLIMYDQKQKMNLSSVSDSLLGSNVAIMYNSSKTQAFAYRKDIDALVRNLGLKLIEAIDVEGQIYSIGDITFAFGPILKNKTLTKDILLRIEIKSLVNAQSFEPALYDNLVKDLFTILGSQAKDAFYKESFLETTKEFMKKESPKETTDRRNKVVFDQTNIARTYCKLFFDTF
jgi:hypothetical protein